MNHYNIYVCITYHCTQRLIIQYLESISTRVTHLWERQLVEGDQHRAFCIFLLLNSIKQYLIFQSRHNTAQSTVNV